MWALLEYCIIRPPYSAPPVLRFFGREARHLSPLRSNAWLFDTVRGQNFSSDALFALGVDIFQQTILNTAYIKTLEISPSARESLSIQTSISRSVRNQSRLHGS